MRSLRTVQGDLMSIGTVQQHWRDVEKKRRLVASITQAFVEAYAIDPEQCRCLSTRLTIKLGEGRQARRRPVTQLRNGRAGSSTGESGASVTALPR
jgi:hypothetical protein